MVRADAAKRHGEIVQLAADVEAIVKQAIADNPDLILKSVQDYQMKQQAKANGVIIRDLRSCCHMVMKGKGQNTHRHVSSAFCSLQQKITCASRILARPLSTFICYAVKPLAL